MSDPNANYEPKPYPKRLYRDHSTSIVVENAQEHDEALAEGFMPFPDLPPAPPADEFTGKAHAELVEMMIAHGRAKLMAMSSEDVIASIKAFRAAQADESAPEAERVAEVSALAADDPLDHDHDGEKGGAVEVSAAVAKLRADLDALGVAYDKRWREASLTKLLDEATKA